MTDTGKERVSGKSPLTICIAEDHGLLREGLCSLIARTPGFRVAGITSSGAGVDALLRAHRPDCLLLDLRLPRRGGWDILSDIHAGKRGTSDWTGTTIILTTYVHPLLLTLARKHGARGLVCKEDDPLEIIQALTATRDPDTFYASSRFLRSADAGLEAPSGREMEILQACARGLRGKEIPVALNISPKTVETYRTRLAAKTGCRSAAELARLALECGLI
ncbi:MAG: response regulator transcription factor [Opitutales bacterium]